LDVQNFEAEKLPKLLISMCCFSTQHLGPQKMSLTKFEALGRKLVGLDF